MKQARPSASRASRTLRALAWPSAALGLILAVAGCYGIPDKSRLDIPGAARPEYAAPEGMTLAAKAAYFEGLLDHYICPDGTLVYRQPTAEGPLVYLPLADVPIWTGTLLGAEAMRFAVARDDAERASARARVLTLTRGLTALREVTGAPGVWARSLWPVEAIDPFPPKSHPAEGEAYRGRYGYKGDVSKDQICGLVFGWAMAWTLVPDPEVRALIAADVRALADHLIEHDLVLHDAFGEPTTYSDLSPRIVGVPIGLHAVLVMATFRLAWVATGEPRYRAVYDEHVAAGAPEIAYWAKIQLFHRTNHNNDNMQILCAAALLQVEADARVRRGVIRGIERTWHYVRHEGNSWLNYAAMAAFGFDADGARDARLVLERFPLDRRRLPFDLRGDPRFPQTFFNSRKGERCAYALPINFRAITSNVWKSDPYALVSGGVDAPIVNAPIDYLLAYYAGRYWGFLDPEA